MRFTLPTLYNTHTSEALVSPHSVGCDCIVTQRRRHRPRETHREMDEEVAGGCWGFILVGHEGRASQVTVGDVHTAVDVLTEVFSSRLHLNNCLDKISFMLFRVSIGCACMSVLSRIHRQFS